MNETERVKHNANYLNLSESQVGRHDELMATWGQDLPDGLQQYIEKEGGAGCGDHIACLMADWIRAGEPDAR